MAAVAPLAILIGAVAAIGLLFASFSEPMFAAMAKLGPRLRSTSKRPACRSRRSTSCSFWPASPSRRGSRSCGVPPTGADALALFAVCAVASFVGGRMYLRRRYARRGVSAFQDQLEGALRTLAGGLRVGLGIRQALVLTSEQSREPVKTEFMRVVGFSSLG